MSVPVYVEPWVGDEEVIWHQANTGQPAGCAGKPYPHLDCSYEGLQALRDLTVMEL